MNACFYSPVNRDSETFFLPFSDGFGWEVYSTAHRVRHHLLEGNTSVEALHAACQINCKQMRHNRNETATYGVNFPTGRVKGFPKGKFVWKIGTSGANPVSTLWNWHFENHLCMISEFQNWTCHDERLIKLPEDDNENTGQLLLFSQHNWTTRSYKLALGLRDGNFIVKGAKSTHHSATDKPVDPHWVWSGGGCGRWASASAGPLR